jgi:ribonuclease HI
MRATCAAHGAVAADSGRAAVGGLVADESGVVRAQVSQSIGLASEAEAQLHAARAVLEAARDAGATDIILRIDAPWLVRALTTGELTEAPGLVARLDTVRNLLRGFDTGTVEVASPEQSSAAAALAQAALAAPVVLPPPEPLPPAASPDDPA